MNKYNFLIKMNTEKNHNNKLDKKKEKKLKYIYIQI